VLISKAHAVFKIRHSINLRLSCRIREKDLLKARRLVQALALFRR